VGDCGPAVQPLLLLAALAVGVAVRRDLDDDPGQPGGQGQHDDRDVEDHEPAAWRVGQVARGRDANVAPGHGHNPGRRCRHAEQQADDEHDHRRAPPPASRQLPVREHPEQDRDEDQK
jgi:hypothetical protein